MSSTAIIECRAYRYQNWLSSPVKMKPIEKNLGERESEQKLPSSRFIYNLRVIIIVLRSIRELVLLSRGRKSVIPSSEISEIRFPCLLTASLTEGGEAVEACNGIGNGKIASESRRGWLDSQTRRITTPKFAWL